MSSSIGEVTHGDATQVVPNMGNVSSPGAADSCSLSCSNLLYRYRSKEGLFNFLSGLLPKQSELVSVINSKEWN
jgi:hypothetical protein